MGGTAQIEEAIMHPAATLDELIRSNAGIETAGDQAQHIFLGRQRVTAESGMDVGNQVQLVILNLQIDLQIRIF